MRSKYLFFVFFLIIAIIPTLLIPFYETSTASENRTKEKFPEFTPNMPIAYMRNTEKFYNSNFAFRNHLYKIYKYIHWDMLGSNLFPNEVIIGKEGWLFTGNKNQQSFDQALGIIPAISVRLDSTCLKVQNMKLFCDSLGIDFYFAIAPDKSTVYPQYYPFNISHPGLTLNTFSNLLQSKYNIEPINLGEYFTKTDSENLLYFKTDSHWNTYGAFWGTKKLLDVIHEKYNNTTLDLSEYDQIPQSLNRMDLSNILDIDMQEKFIHIMRKREQYTTTDFYVDYGYWKPSKIEKTKKKVTETNIKCVIFKDSFFDNMRDFFCNNMDQVIIATSIFDKNMILNERPNFVVFEVVERRLLSLNIENFEY